MKEIRVNSNRRAELIDITEKIQNIVNDEKINEGYIIVYVPHTTAAVTINEGLDPDVKKDIIKTLEELIPKNGNYSHIEGNSDAHIKSSLIGTNTTVLIEDGRLLLGTWQRIFFFEGDGPRSRRLLLYIHKEK